MMENSPVREDRSFLSVVSSRVFDHMSLEEVCAVLSVDILPIRDEVEVFMAAVKWLTADWELRKDHTQQVMKCVRFDHIKPVHIVELRGLSHSPHLDAVLSVPEVETMLDRGMRLALRRQYYMRCPNDQCYCEECLNMPMSPCRNYTGGRRPFQFITYEGFLEDLEQQRLDEEDEVEEEEDEAVGDRNEDHSENYEEEEKEVEEEEEMEQNSDERQPL